MRSLKPSRQRVSASLKKKSTVKKQEQPLVRIIHLDCGTGGDCTVLYTDDEFIVIDGGKGPTGIRLTALLKHLLEEKKVPLAFIVSHFDLDHFYGLFRAIEDICRDPGPIKMAVREKLKVLTLLTPADIKILNRTTQTYPYDMENASKVFIDCNSLRKYATGYKIKIDYSLPETQTFKNGIQLELQSNTKQYFPSVCNENNASSLQWILRDSNATTSTTYYTGGDSESGPLSASIIKLDHHGSTVNGTNAQTEALEEASHWVIMGAGRVHKHPGVGLLETAKSNNPWILMTQHHFTDGFLNNPQVLVSRTKEQWGDVGISLYKGARNLFNISASQHLLNNDKDSNWLSDEESIQLDKSLNDALSTIRDMEGCNKEPPRARTDTSKTKIVLKCRTPGCNNEANRVFVSEESVDLIVCEAHETEEFESQMKQLRKKEDNFNKKRKKTYSSTRKKSDEEESEEEFEDQSEDDSEDETGEIYRQKKKVKNDKNKNKWD